MHTLTMPDGSTVRAQAIGRGASVSREKSCQVASDVKRNDGSDVIAEVTTTITTVRGETKRSIGVVIREPIVGKSGRFIEASVHLKANKKGRQWVVVGENGRLQLTRFAQAKPHEFVFYYDLCHGLVDGVAADPAKWALWERVRQMRFKGRRVRPDQLADAEMFHGEVLRRRANNENGVEYLSDEAVDKALADIRGGDEGAHPEHGLSTDEKLEAALLGTAQILAARGRDAD
jgi:hypothetical protein